jgi:hypothetical protein
MSNFIAIKSKATILKMLDDEIKEAHETSLPTKEYDDIFNMDMPDKYGKCFECGWISALKYMKDKVGEK